MIQEIRSHIAKKLSEAELEEYPFPHLIIEQIFPERVYEKIIEYNPFKRNAGVEWISQKQSSSLKTSTPYYARKQINLYSDKQVSKNATEEEFWKQIKNCFLEDQWFEKQVLKKYKEYFVIRFGELVESEEFFNLFKKEFFLQRHDPGYYLGPHTDVPTRVFTCIFSFAEQEGFENYGTQLCAPKDEMIRCWGNNHYSPESFIVRKVAPYKPNNFLLFFKTRQSFHSVQKIPENIPNQRYGMQFQFYEPRKGIFTDLSEPELLLTKHGKKSKEKESSSSLNKVKRTMKKILTNSKEA